MKLEKINKKNIYTVPDQYFDELPQRIQKRISNKKHHWNWHGSLVPVLKYALPAISIILVVLYLGFFRNNNFSTDPETLLAQVNTEDIIAYLENSDISTDDIIDEYQINGNTLDLMQDNVLPQQDLQLDEEDMQIILQEYNLEIDSM